jgi:Winged helix DNA-binding domain
MRAGQPDTLRRRLVAQWLVDRPGATVAAVAAHLAGLQAQDAGAVRLAVRARSRRLTAAAMRRSAASRSVVTTWLMRGTLHLVAAADLRWMLVLFGPRNVASGARRRRQLGLDERTCARALPAIERILAAESPLSRADLVGRLAGMGVAIDPSGQAPAHLVAYAASSGLICRGPWLGGDEPGYVLLDDWLPAGPTLDPGAALAELARRYVAAYGPATADDLAAWSGLPLGAARRGLAHAAADLAEVAAETYATPDAARRPDGGGRVVRLVGPFDAYLLGYRSRDLALDPRYARRIQAGGGIIHPAVLVDGRVAGTWRLRRGRGPAAVAVEPFEALDRDLLPALDAEAADIGRFLGIDTVLSV